MASVLAVVIAEIVAGGLPGRNTRRMLEPAALRTGAWAAAVESALARSSWLARTTRPPANDGLLRAFSVTTPKVVLAPDEWLFLASEVRTAPARELSANARRKAADMAAVASWLAARGTRTLVVPVPSKASLHPARLEHVRPRFHATYPIALGELHRAGLWALDLSGALDPSAAATFLRDDSHWTGEGALRAAEAVACEIRRTVGPGLPGAAVRGRIVRGDPRRRAGDLLAMLELPARRVEQIAAMDVDVQAVAARGGRLGIAGTQPLVLVGTSFSATRHLAKLLSVALGRRVEGRHTVVAGRQGAPGRLVPLLMDVAHGRRDAPAILVWEIPERHLWLEGNPEQYAMLREIGVDVRDHVPLLEE